MIGVSGKDALRTLVRHPAQNAGARISARLHAVADALDRAGSAPAPDLIKRILPAAAVRRGAAARVAGARSSIPAQIAAIRRLVA